MASCCVLCKSWVIILSLNEPAKESSVCGRRIEAHRLEFHQKIQRRDLIQCRSSNTLMSSGLFVRISALWSGIVGHRPESTKDPVCMSDLNINAQHLLCLRDMEVSDCGAYGRICLSSFFSDSISIVPSCE
ncbi:hypothetical protein AVEN_260259-1 [Araneus ventricosus]|uniref:Uncharacterized protein n=1 Tax=Araneus ventricosus TaxID=182803 RepID=A0A4Y2FKT0_ARAVE|nr:hypothetical protein AVEN_260259-1 [Araneus ventricosus]